MARFSLGLALDLELASGVVCSFDEADAPLVLAHSWHKTASAASKTLYAVTWVRTAENKRQLLSMHRLLMGLPKVEVDHRDGDGLNNRRSNLRLALRVENARNRRQTDGGTSPFKGVRVERRGQCAPRFLVEIQQGGERLRLGRFKSEHKAARAYDAAAKVFHGAFAKTNQQLGLFDLHPDRVMRF